ncbi:MAG: hypothetical protein WDZ80_01975 [Candidatus Paceibacterota bacterium]
MPENSSSQKLKDKDEKILGGLFLIVLILFWKIFGFLTGLIASVVGIFIIMVLLQKNPKHSKSLTPVFGILVVVTLLVFFLPALQSDKQHKKETEEILSGVAQNYDYATEGGTLERNIELKLLHILGADTKIYELDLENGQMKIEYLAKENLSTGLTLGGIFQDTKNIVQEFSSATTPSINRIVVEPYLTLVDQYGQEEISKVASLTITQNTWKKINWDNFLLENIPTVADEYWVHPALTN